MLSRLLWEVSQALWSDLRGDLITHSVLVTESVTGPITYVQTAQYWAVLIGSILAISLMLGLGNATNQYSTSDRDCDTKNSGADVSTSAVLCLSKTLKVTVDLVDCRPCATENGGRGMKKGDEHPTKAARNMIDFTFIFFTVPYINSCLVIIYSTLASTFHNKL